MNVIILHCHYRRGGVTQVVENHIAGLADAIDGALYLASDGDLSGLADSTLQKTLQLSVDALGYDRPSGDNPSERLAGNASDSRRRVSRGD